jgi:hypothetical protein
MFGKTMFLQKAQRAKKAGPKMGMGYTFGKKLL